MGSTPPSAAATHFVTAWCREPSAGSLRQLDIGDDIPDIAIIADQTDSACLPFEPQALNPCVKNEPTSAEPTRGGCVDWIDFTSSARSARSLCVAN